MSRPFLVDLCVVRHAIEGVNARGLLDGSSTRFMINAYDRCHKIVLDKKLRGRLSDLIQESMIKAGNGEMIVVAVVDILKQFLQTRGKVVQLDETPPGFPGEGLIPKEDRDVARLARLHRVPIVTADAGFTKAVENSPALRDHDVYCLTPKAALAEIQASVVPEDCLNSS